MMKTPLLLFFLFITPLFYAQDYIYDEKSMERQQALKKDRATNVFRDVSMVVGSVFFYAITDGQVNIMYSDEVRIKKIILENASQDTLYINMMCDLMWDDNDYCDFMDIRLPPQQECKLLVPRHTRYNLHFRTTATVKDNEMMIELNTDKKKHIKLSDKLIAELSAITLPQP